MPKLECAAILFDMDGVLVDSTPAVARAWHRWALANGLDPEAVIDGAHGRRTVETVRAFAPHIDAVEEARRIESAESMDLDGVAVIPGAAQLLKSLPEGRWGVVTSASRSMATARLQDTGLIVPRVLVSADDVTDGKPHPEPYLKGASALGIAPELCLVFEDSPAGIRAANSAGMRVIALQTTYPPEELRQAVGMVRDFNEIRVQQNKNGSLEITIAE
jgi:mannitol-1-/sugar-/sorbitol-6-phosphatase